MRSLLSRLDRFFAPPPAPGRVGWLSEWTYAHRGLHGNGVPENSLAAYAGAVERGMGIECDIQRSRDGQAMLDGMPVLLPDNIQETFFSLSTEPEQ